jgi:predicted nucleotidyltransferase
MTQFEVLLTALQREGVSFVIIGGIAATLHGSARLTNDLDIVYERSSENYTKLVRALQPFDPYLRGAPVGLPFRFDAETIKRGLNFTLRTTSGDIDLLGELTGVGTFHAVLSQSLEVSLFGAEYRFINLEALIRSKRAAGRAKDLEVIAELETIREERNR